MLGHVQGALGETFDIHGGGNDLIFPHHENEIAQSCCANHTDQMAQIWLHNEMLLVEGKKMSKSLGNFFTVRDLLDQGVPGEVIRFVFLSTHYSKPMDWTEKKREEAEKTLRKWRSLTNGAGSGGAPDPGVISVLADDLNTWGAISLLMEKAKSLLGKSHGAVAQFEIDDFAATARVLGLLNDDAEMGSWAFDGAAKELLGLLTGSLVAARETAKHTKDFTAVDALKSALTAAGVEVRMSKEGVELIPGPGFDPAKLEGL